MILYTAIYNLAIGAYTTAIRIASLFNHKAGLFIKGRSGLLNKIRAAYKDARRKSIWMHCASLGEFEQGRPVLEALREQHPEYAVIVTFFSPSGYEVRKDYSGADYVFYLPMDTKRNADQLISIIDPVVCIFVKYEFWYHYLNTIRERKIPAILISAIFKKEQGFFKWYGGLQRAMVNCFTHIFVQDAASLRLLEQIRITNTTVSGDTRFDRVIKAAQQITNLPAADSFSYHHKVLVAGSTWKEDEQLLRKVLEQLPLQWKIILVPHEVNESHIAQIEQLFEGNTVRWSQTETTTTLPDCRVLLVDKVGLLLQLYKYATVAWIGGGFGKDGVHNVLEAAVYGTPCFYGPIFHQFIEAQQLIDCGGGFTVSTATAFIKKLESIEHTDHHHKHASAAKHFVYSKGGATEMVINYINNNILT